MIEFDVDKAMEAMYNGPMNNHVADAISCSIRGFRLPRYHEIPNMGLYLEQTTKYINQCIQPLGFENVTSTMVRNYVKHGLITNPVKKQYTADQIAHLIALALLKQVTPLEHINDLFQLLAQGGTYSVPVAYDYFCEEFENLLSIYNKYPIKELIIHPRVREDYYKNKPNLTVFEMALL